MEQMEQINEAIRQLTGAVNAQIELSKQLEQRLTRLENPIIPIIESSGLAAPRTEQDLKDISKLPDCVKDLQVFDGNPIHYVSWVHNVESILKDYEIMRNKPIYRAILQSIRQKIRGNADSALISYNIFDDDWVSIKKCLSLHYADKRDLRTLEHQLGNLQQKNSSLDEFYANVNHQFSLIVNKIKTENYSAETINVLVETYRNKALDVFIRGLNGDLSKMLIVQRPQTLPEAYSSCLEIQNLNYRNLPIHYRNIKNSVTAPINQFSRSRFDQPFEKNQNFLPPQKRNMAFNIQHQAPQTPVTFNRPPPSRPFQPKPPVPMEVDQSVQTRQVNYMNRPNNQPREQQSDQMQRKENTYGSFRNKQQGLYHMETPNNEYEDYIEQYSDREDLEETDAEVAEENAQLNFMTAASLAYHT